MWKGWLRLMWNEWECEMCNADMRNKWDEDGVGNYAGHPWGWVCDDCMRSIEEMELDEWYEKNEEPR